MRSIFRLIAQYQVFLVFLLLQLLSFFLLGQNNNFHKAFFINSGNVLSGNIYKKTDDLTHYIGLRQQNAFLMAQLSAEKQRNKTAFFIDTSQTYMRTDTARKLRYKYTFAKVLNSTTNFQNNFITLDKGKKDGIRPQMALTNGYSVVGIVRNVSENFAVAYTIINTKVSLSAKLKKYNQVGNITWSGADSHFADLNDVPSYLKIQAGDTVVTSGYSTNFPADIPIGTVHSLVPQAGTSNYAIQVRLFTDFNRVPQVIVMHDLMKMEIDSLQNVLINEDAKR
jgi:rod shape-determining protein MreC